MKKPVVSVLAAALACACFAQDPAPAAPAATSPAIEAVGPRARPPRPGMHPGRPFPPGGMRFPMMQHRSFGTLSDGRQTKLYRIEGAGGLILDVSDYGGRLVRCYAPDKYSRTSPSASTPPASTSATASRWAP